MLVFEVGPTSVIHTLFFNICDPVDKLYKKGKDVQSSGAPQSYTDQFLGFVF